MYIVCANVGFINLHRCGILKLHIRRIISP